VIVAVVSVHVCAGLDEQSYNFLLDFPPCTMQRCRTVLVASVDQCGIAGQQFFQPGNLGRSWRL